MARKGFIDRTYEVTDADMDSIIVGSTELRIHYLFTPGCPETGPSYASGGEPASGPEIELDYVEEEVSGKWQRVPVDGDLWLWAETYLEKHPDDVIEDVAECDAADREYFAELRRGE